MTQKEAVDCWLAGAEDAWDTAKTLLNAKKFDHSLFFLHLALEKIIKAVFIKNNDNHPPLIHYLDRLAEAAGITLGSKQKSQLIEANSFNTSGRYEDYKFKLYKKATPEYTKKWHQTGRKLFDYLKGKL